VTRLCTLEASPVSEVKVVLSRRQVTSAMGLSLVSALLGACATGSTTAPDGSNTAPLNRVSAIGKRLAETGFLTPSTWRFGVLNLPSFVACQPEKNTIIVSEGIVALAENDGQIAAILAHTLVRARAALNDPAKQKTLREAILLDLSHAPTTLGVASADSGADSEAIQALARAGYDPRDARVIWQRIGRVGGDGVIPHATRLAAMAAELRKLGYQV
jgi:hypothetical protein